MTDTNHVILVGRVTRDVGSDERSFGYVGTNGIARANVGLAVNRSRKDASGQWVEDTSFFDVTVWGKQAENLKQYLVKGKQILVDGYLKQDRWERDGQKYSKVQVVADNIQLLGGGSRGDSGGSSNYGGGYNAGGRGAYGAAPTGGAPAPADAAGGPASVPADNYTPANGPDGVPFPEDIPF